jgi:HEAT repeat protein
MTSNDLADTIRRSKGNGARLLEIVDEFRHGRNIVDVDMLLFSGDTEIISIGAWMLSELPLELYNSVDIVARLRELLSHDDASVRFNAFSAIFPALDWQRSDSRELLTKLRKDPNHGIRQIADSAANHVPLD